MDISIIIVTHNHAEYIKDCVSSCINALRNLEGEIIVVDNCSVDGTVDLLSPFLEKIVLIKNTERRGFAANNNTAIKRAKGKYILILNPDTTFEVNVLENLLKIAEKEKFGILAPKLVFPNGETQMSCRRFPNLFSFIARRTPLRKILTNSKSNKKHLMSNISHDEMQEVDWVLGACMLAPASVFNKVGLFDERYFLYVEDIDICYRMKLAGLKVLYAPQVVITHHHLAVSDKKFFTKRTLFHFNSMLKFILKYKFKYKYL